MYYKPRKNNKILASKATVTDQTCKVIQNYLNKCIDILNNTNQINLQTMENVNVQKKVDKQVRFYSTKKKKKSRKLQRMF